MRPNVKWLLLNFKNGRTYNFRSQKNKIDSVVGEDQTDLLFSRCDLVYGRLAMGPKHVLIHLLLQMLRSISCLKKVTRCNNLV